MAHLPGTVAFLHTAAVHVATFDALLAEAAPGLTARHVVDETLLADARARGLDDTATVAALDRRLREAADGGAPVLCTCSTLGGLAETLAGRLGVAALRVDRPMAVRAVDLAAAGTGRIAVVAALASTVAPTEALLTACADAAGVTVTPVPVRCEEAWARFEAGDMEGYLRAVTRAVEDGPPDVDVVVLAQASMAPVAARVRVSVPVLSSPRLGVDALVRLAGATAPHD